MGEGLMEEKMAQETYRAVAYVTVPASENWRWIGREAEGEVISEVDVNYVTHINYAFGMIKSYQFEPGVPGKPLKEGKKTSKEAYKDPTDGNYHYKATLSGWIEEMHKVVDGDQYVRALVKLKEKKPELKVLVSIGGWNSDGFCYMSRTQGGRLEFINSCIELIQKYNLDGIDLDWEYPNNGVWANIAHCEHCVEDAKQLLKEFREVLDRTFTEDPKLLTIASGCSLPWVDKETFPALDYMNVMCYDYNPGVDESQAGLTLGKQFVKDHADMVGDTKENRAKIHMGVPFYNAGGEYLVPYWKEWNGHIDASPEIIREKMEWVKENGYGGGFYWCYSMDVFEQDVEDPSDPRVKCLQKAVYETLNKEE